MESGLAIIAAQALLSVGTWQRGKMGRQTAVVVLYVLALVVVVAWMSCFSGTDSGNG
jgi:tryptophan-rich sensory protein